MLFLSAALFIPFTKASAQESDAITHTVEKGQGLYSIARIYGVTEEEIIKHNPGSDKMIKTGQKLVIPARSNVNGKFHTIAAGETPYSIAKSNGISIELLYKANPGINAGNFKAGQTIIIPEKSEAAAASVETVQEQHSSPLSVTEKIRESANGTSVTGYRVHTVQKKETIYRISRMYGITQAEFLDANPKYRYAKLQIGSVVRIPYRNDADSTAVSDVTDTRPSDVTSPYSRTDILLGRDTTAAPVEAALIMPFNLDAAATQDQNKMVEFYQGALIALEEMKNSGISVNLHVYDTGNENRSLLPILQKKEMAAMDIIFGPRYGQHIKAAAEFAEKNRIPLVLPINSSVDEVYSNPYVYQLNTPQSYLMSEVEEHFFRQFRNPKLIILDTGIKDNSQLVGRLVEAFDSKALPHQRITAGREDLKEAVSAALKPGYDNIFILTSAGSSELAKLLPVLQLVVREKPYGVSTNLFGYPEYQIYASEHLEEFYEVDTWFYSWFFTNNQSAESKHFGNRFHQAYSRHMMHSYPSFATYGYDMTKYFLSGVAKYGKRLPDNLGNIRTAPLQMGFKFRRASNWGGFINNKVFFVHMSDRYVTEKVDFDI